MQWLSSRASQTMTVTYRFFLTVLLSAGLFLPVLPPAGLLVESSPQTLPFTGDFPIYTEGLEPGWGNWSWDVIHLELRFTSVVHWGDNAVAVDLGTWGGLSFGHADFNTDPWKALTFYIHGGTEGGQQLRVFMHGAGGQTGAELPAVSLNNPAYIHEGAVEAGTWKQVCIPLADLRAENTVISRVNIQAVEDQPPFHVDDMWLVTSTTCPEPLHIMVDAGHILGPIPRTVFGTNAAMWNQDLHRNTDVIDKVRASGVTIIRFPGGSEADRYHWQEFDPGNRSNAWSTNTTELIQFVRAVGAEPMFTVNFGSGTAQEAAGWVRFTNIEHNWDIKYWEVGNEIYGEWENSWTHDATEYVNGDATHDGFNTFCQAMKVVDPTILVGAVGTINPAGAGGWGPTVLDLAGDCMDFYVVHHYPFRPGDLDYQQLLMEPPESWPAIGDNVRRMIADHAPGRDIKIAVTEYNSYFTEPEELATQTVNMLFLADALGQIIDQGFAFANHWDILNNLTANGGDYGFLLVDSANYRQPSYYVFPLWRRAGNQRIAGTLNREAATGMTLYATRHSMTGDVTLVVINKTGVDQTGFIEMDEFKAAGTVEAYIAQGDSLHDPSVAYNGDENPPSDLSTVPPMVTTGVSETFTYTFPAYSVTSLTIRRCLTGDTDDDGDVDVDDIMKAAGRWDCRCGAACYNGRYDVDGDCYIDVFDIMGVAADWGQTCSTALSK